MLYIRDLYAGGDVNNPMLLPSECISPYELRHLHQLARCSVEMFPIMVTLWSSPRCLFKALLC